MAKTSESSGEAAIATPEDPSAGDGQRAPLADLVADHIRAAIVEGRLKPGGRIRQEAVARECETSRMPVREALTRLQNEGLITFTSHVGARVATLDLSELDELYLMREELEPLALRHSVSQLTGSDRETLRKQMLEMEACADPADPSHWVELDRLFHLHSYSKAGLPRLLEIVEGFWNRTQQYRRAYTRLPARFGIAHMEHRLLLEAIEHGQAEDAVTISRLHIRRTRLALDEHTELFGARA
jgi:DNA-binding GntR family transcriptional regulator